MASAWTLFDAQDFPSVEDVSQEVFDLVRTGNLAFRSGRFEEAITCYSKAQLLKQGDPVILSNRSASFCRISQALRDRSAVESEYRPLNGLDPTTHAELALKDAEKVMSCVRNSTRAHFLKANALVLLERYEDARETIISGLQLDPLSNLLQSCLRDLDRVSVMPVERMGNRNPQRTDDFECTLCLKLLYEPVTTPCGHSFCRACLLQSMDHGNKCPICRTILFISPRTYPVSVTLKNIIQKNCPEDYAERRAEHQNLTYPGADLLPLFVMDVVIPCQKMALNIFEPRYRLMVRRVMEGNRRMGMVGIDSATGSIANHACEVEIIECEPLPDGRFYLEVEGRRRFRILRSWDQDGYRIAEVEWFQDLQPPGLRERQDLEQTTRGAAELAGSWIARAREDTRIGRRSRQMELLQAEGMPGANDPERFSFWLVNLLTLRPSEKLELLRMRDTRERISRGLVYMRAREESCRVQ